MKQCKAHSRSSSPLLLASLNSLQALEYPHATAEPQKSGCPLTAEERAYVVDKPEHDRRPDREAITWLKEKRDATKPFFLAVWTHEPHYPIKSDPKFKTLYPDLTDDVQREPRGRDRPHSESGARQ